MRQQVNLYHPIFRKQQKWGDVAQALTAHAEVEDDAAKRVDTLLELGELYESHLAQTPKAIDASEPP